MSIEASAFDYLLGGLVLLLIVGGGIAATVSARVRGVIVLFIIVSLAIKFAFFREEKAAEAAVQAHSSAPIGSPSMPESVPITIENYRSKGDSVKLECSGSTGNIKCKPAH